MDPRELLAFLRERVRGERKGKRGKPIRKKTDLNLETLESRDVPTCYTISGYVFLDAHNNGLPQSGDAPYSNIPLELLDSSGNVISTTTTDSTGYYQFQKNPTIDTSPQTLTRTLNFSQQMTDSTRTGSIAQFDPSLGTLTSVDVINTGSITSDISAENTSTTSAATITATVSGVLSLSGAGFQIDTTLDNNAGTFNASVFDGTLDFGGTSGKDFGQHTANGSRTTTLTGSALQEFLGTGTVQLTESTVATSTASGGGNVLVGVQSLGSANVQVVYHYIPGNCLKPGTYTIAELAQPPGTLDGKITTNGTLVPHAPGNDSITVTLINQNLPTTTSASSCRAASPAPFTTTSTATASPTPATRPSQGRWSR